MEGIIIHSQIMFGVRKRCLKVMQTTIIFKLFLTPIAIDLIMELTFMIILAYVRRKHSRL